MNQEIIKTLSLYAVADLFDAEALQDALYKGCQQIDEEFCVKNNIDTSALKTVRRHYALIVKSLLNAIYLYSTSSITLHDEIKHCRTVEEIDNVICLNSDAIMKYILFEGPKTAIA